MTTRFELVDEGFADPCLTTWPPHHIKGIDEYRSMERPTGSNSLLHLGRWRSMNELRPHIPVRLSTLPSDSCEFRGPAEACEARFCGKRRISEFVTAVLLVRLPDKLLTFRRATDRARTDDPSADRLVLWQLSYRAILGNYCCSLMERPTETRTRYLHLGNWRSE